MAKPARDTTQRQRRRGVLAPFSPCFCQTKQLVDGSDAVASDSSLQLLIPAFRRSVVGKGADSIRRPVAYVLSRRFNSRKTRFLKKPAQPPPHIRIGEPGGP